MARSVNRAFVVLQPPVTEGGVRTELSVMKHPFCSEHPQKCHTSEPTLLTGASKVHPEELFQVLFYFQMG